MISKITFTLLILVAAFNAFAQDDTRLSATWKVQKYDLTATVPQVDSDRALKVKATLDIKNVSGKPASTLSLRLNSAAEVSTVTINGATIDFTKSLEAISSAVSLQKIVMRVGTKAAGEVLVVSVDYKLTVKDNSGLNAISAAGSQFLPTSFWYPTPNSWYFPRGADYAPFHTTIIDAKNSVLSSGTAQTATTFDQKLNGQPFFTTGNWEKVIADGVEVYYPKTTNSNAAKRAGELAALANEAKAFNAKLLGTAPAEPIRIIGVKRGGGFSGGGAIFVEDAIFRRTKIDSQNAMLVADSVAKVWLGNAVAVYGDGYGTLREGLTTYIATQFIEAKYGKDVADVERLRQRTAYNSVAKRDAPLNLVSPLDDYYYPAVSNKGAMAWSLLVKKVGTEAFFSALRADMQDGALSLAEVRTSFPDQKVFLDYIFDQITDTNLLAGLPRIENGETVVALRNTGTIDVTVDVTATTESGKTLVAPVTLRAKDFGQVSFKTAEKIKRVEIDSQKNYPQTDYSDDVAPRELTDSDLLLAVKRQYDKQEFIQAEKTAKAVLSEYPRFDDVRVLLARSLLSQNKPADAEKEYQNVLNERLPTARSIAWANAGLADIAQRGNNATDAVRYAVAALEADAEYGANLAARAIRNKAAATGDVEQSVRAYFAQFDKVAVSNRKAEIEALALAGEATRFVSGVSGGTVEWKTQVLHVDMLDANTAVVETALNIKLLNKANETGMAVFRLSKVGNDWKLYSVDILEVR